MIAIASISPTLGASIYNPAFDQLREQLHATDTQLALSLSIFILFQGGFPVCKFPAMSIAYGWIRTWLTSFVPIVWSTIAEITGRKVRVLHLLTRRRSYLARRLIILTSSRSFTLSPMQYVRPPVYYKNLADFIALQLFITGTIVAGRANSMTLLSTCGQALRKRVHTDLPVGSLDETATGFRFVCSTSHWSRNSCRHLRKA